MQKYKNLGGKSNIHFYKNEVLKIEKAVASGRI